MVPQPFARIARPTLWSMGLLLGMVSTGSGIARAQAPETGPDSTQCWSTEASAPKGPSVAVPSEESRIASTAPAPNFPALQKACWIELDQIDPLIDPHTSKPLYWIDIRSSRSANALPLSGALRIAADEITLKPFLRPATLVLIGTGWDDSVVLTACERLTKAGLSVRALKGGVRAWQAAGRPVGWVAKGWGSDEIDPSDFIEAAPRERWPVIGLDLPATFTAPVPAKRWARANTQSSWSPSRLFPTAARQNLPIVVLAAEPTVARHTPVAIQNKQLIWVRGGVAAYQKALEQQYATAAKSSRALTRGCKE